MFNQGIVIYETQLKPTTTYSVNIVVHDLATITIDNQYIDFLDRTQHQHYKNVSLKCDRSSPCVLRIMVEAMGHINYDISMEEDYKGLVQFETSNDDEFEWTMYKIPINE